uniref:Uncharacterized protein n=1 Tax=Arundo donax TaxID=35708 RepID=A0A0A8YCT4_ARUDO
MACVHYVNLLSYAYLNFVWHHLYSYMHFCWIDECARNFAGYCFLSQ